MDQPSLHPKAKGAHDVNGTELAIAQYYSIDSDRKVPGRTIGISKCA